MLEWMPLLQKGAETLAGPIVKSAFEMASKSFRSKSPYSTLDFRPHFTFAYHRCTKIKTLFSRDQPVDLLTHYVHLTYRLDNQTFDEFSLIEKIMELKHALIISTGGAGKSMFMRYLWIALFINPRGKIPIFVELRRLNEIDDVDFNAFLFRTAIQSSDVRAQEFFQGALNEGQFALILDGMDEVHEAKRNKVELQILELASKYPGNVVVLSGRPEDRYNGWQSFYRFTIEPLSNKQTIELVNRIEFDKAIKSRFVRKLRKGEFKKHSSFLSRPLLAVIMLVMYGYYAEVPEKVHLFYEHAFDAMFYLHDASKEAFSRQRYTSYQKDLFKRYLGYFSLITYNDEIISFSPTELSDYLSKAARLANEPIDKEAFIRDLKECVCVLHDDGINSVFTHRSFQEYFCAFCLSQTPTARVAPLLKRFALRPADAVIALLYDMNPPLVEDAYLLPCFNELEELLRKLPNSPSLENILDAFELEFRIEAQLNKKTGEPIMLTWGTDSKYPYVSGRHTTLQLLTKRSVSRGSDPDELTRLVKLIRERVPQEAFEEQLSIKIKKGLVIEIASSTPWLSGRMRGEPPKEDVRVVISSSEISGELAAALMKVEDIYFVVEDAKTIMREAPAIRLNASRRKESMDELLAI